MSRLSLSDLQAFAAVARLRSFRQAAEELGVSPSALSHALRGMEARIGLRLLHRTTRSVSPTEAGERLLARLTPALHDIQSALDEVNQFRASPIGTLRINAPRAACELVIAPLLAPFLSRHPGMQVELVSDDAFVDIVADGFDAGVRFGESLQQDMVAVPLGPPQRFIVVASPDFLARHGEPRDPHELVRFPCMRIRFPSGRTYRWEFAKDGQAVEVDVQGPLASNDMQAMARAALDGIGLAYVYEPHAREALQSGRLKQVLADWCPVVPGFYLYYPSRRGMPAGLRAFVDLLQETQTQAPAFKPEPA